MYLKKTKTKKYKLYSKRAAEQKRSVCHAAAVVPLRPNVGGFCEGTGVKKRPLLTRRRAGTPSLTRKGPLFTSNEQNLDMGTTA